MRIRFFTNEMCEGKGCKKPRSVVGYYAVGHVDKRQFKNMLEDAGYDAGEPRHVRWTVNAAYDDQKHFEVDEGAAGAAPITVSMCAPPKVIETDAKALRDARIQGVMSRARNAK